VPSSARLDKVTSVWDVAPVPNVACDSSFLDLSGDFFNTCPELGFSCYSKVFETYDCFRKYSFFLQSHRRFALLSMALRDIIFFILNVRVFTVLVNSAFNP